MCRTTAPEVRPKDFKVVAAPKVDLRKSEKRVDLGGCSRRKIGTHDDVAVVGLLTQRTINGEQWKTLDALDTTIALKTLKSPAG
uniref:Integrase n=1 Tax=Steinernema glaseri TaxID=37863 RepID=A0A1I7YZH7_9BILA